VSSPIEIRIFCEHCGKKYQEKDLNNLYKIKRSEIQNVAIKKETDKEKFKQQVTLYRCRSCGHALRVKNYERPKQPEN
jgi:ribosomal protein L44E